MAKSSALVEEYTEAMYKLGLQGVAIVRARLAKRMGVSAPTVTGVLQRMAKEGLIEVDAQNRVRLTSRGQELGATMVRKHRLSERLLTDLLGMDPDEVHGEACRLEHSLSDEVEKRLASVLGHPATCPHGYPIPGAAPLPADTAPLTSHAAGDSAVVSCLPEEDPALLKYLRSKGIYAGARLQVLEMAPFKGPLTLRTAKGDVALGVEVASQVLVRPASPED